MTQGPTLLIADDELLVRTAARRYFERLGYTVLEAEDGVAALALIEQQGPQIGIVILDLTMPNMNGLEAFQRLRELDPELPVVLCSGYCLDDAPLDSALLDRKTAFMQKPFQMDQITRLVSRLCR